MQRTKKNKSPVLKCFITEAGHQLKAWCPFCETWHFHGSRPWLKAREKARVVAHCARDNSPFKDNGYYLQLINKMEAREIAKYLEKLMHEA